MKILGSVLILICSAALGIVKSYELVLHVKELEEIKRIFFMVKNELIYSKSMFEDIFAEISRKTEGRYQIWMQNLAKELNRREQQSFLDIWTACSDQFVTQLHLKQEEKCELYRVGRNLSCLDSINLYLEQLDLSIQSARTEAQNKKKLYQSMGVLGGVFLVIVLL